MAQATRYRQISWMARELEQFVDRLAPSSESHTMLILLLQWFLSFYVLVLLLTFPARIWKRKTVGHLFPAVLPHGAHGADAKWHKQRGTGKYRGWLWH